MAGEFIKDLATALKPPPEGEPSAEYKWRATVALSIIVGYALALGVHAAIWGFLTPVGFGGFAYASDLKTHVATEITDRMNLQRSIDSVGQQMQVHTQSIMAVVISGQVIAMHTNYCIAERSKNIALAENESSQISNLQASYMRVSGGQPYPLEPCP